MNRVCRSRITQTASLNLLGECMLAKKVLCLVHLDFEEYHLEIGGSYLIKYFCMMGFYVMGSRIPLIREQIVCVMFQVGLELNLHVADIKQDSKCWLKLGQLH